MARLTFLGTADAFHSAGRRHSAYLLEDGTTRVAVDFGPTALLSLRILGIDPASLDGVLLTHLHGDHALGLPFLVLDGLFASVRTRALSILGPPGTRERVSLAMRAAYDELERKARPFELHLEERAPGEPFSLGSLRGVGFEVSHMDPPHRPLSLRLETGDGRVVAFSGDTEWCPGLVACARGADLLVAECTGLAPPLGRHLTWEDWRTRHREVGARRIVLSHLGLSVRERAKELLASLPEPHAISFADDGLVLEV